MASDALAHRAGLVLSTGQGAVLSEHDYGRITGLREEPDENALTRGALPPDGYPDRLHRHPL